MRFYSSIVALLLSALLVGASGAHAQKVGSKGTGRGESAGRGEGKGRGEGGGKGEDKSKHPVEQTVAATATVNIALTTRAGNISVRGWDRQEVHAESKEPDAKIELRKSSGAADASSPASQVEVLISNKSQDDPDYDESDFDNDVSLDVPRGATVFLKTEDGDIEVADVAEAHLETSGGRMELSRVSKATEATSIGGDVSLENSSGRARLTSFGGSIEVTDFRALDANDFLRMRTTSGDILLKQVTQTRVEATTISGELKLEGKLARGGNYSFTTTTGDVTLALPADSSFKLNARISENGEIVTEFPIKYSGSTSPFSLMQAGRLIGTYGTGDATLNLTSFNGTIRLWKR